MSLPAVVQIPPPLGPPRRGPILPAFGNLVPRGFAPTENGTKWFVTAPTRDIDFVDPAFRHVDATGPMSKTMEAALPDYVHRHAFDHVMPDASGATSMPWRAIRHGAQPGFAVTADGTVVVNPLAHEPAARGAPPLMMTGPKHLKARMKAEAEHQAAFRKEMTKLLTTEPAAPEQIDPSWRYQSALVAQRAPSSSLLARYTPHEAPWFEAPSGLCKKRMGNCEAKPGTMKCQYCGAAMGVVPPSDMLNAHYLPLPGPQAGLRQPPPRGCKRFMRKVFGR